MSKQATPFQECCRHWAHCQGEHWGCGTLGRVATQSHVQTQDTREGNPTQLLDLLQANQVVRASLRPEERALKWLQEASASPIVSAVSVDGVRRSVRHTFPVLNEGLKLWSQVR